uniref:Uncharacterized protein n=1 Tax=Chenopodium quinoa TaxID=63459 RepID=A0A803LG10_CHEQI
MLPCMVLTTKSQYLETANGRLILSLPNGLVHQPISEILPRRPTRGLKILGRRRRPPVSAPPPPQKAPVRNFVLPNPPPPPIYSVSSSAHLIQSYVAYPLFFCLLLLIDHSKLRPSSKISREEKPSAITASAPSGVHTYVSGD